MQFYPWITSYDEYKAWFKAEHGKREKPDRIEEFNANRKVELNGYGSRGFPEGHIRMQQDRLVIEEKWRNDGKPYYNVHPFLVKKFCKVNLSKVPAEFVEMPHGYSAVAVKFGEQHEELTIRGGSVLGVPEGSYIKSILMTKGFNALRHYEAQKDFSESLYCMLNFSSKPGETGEPNQLVVLPVWFKQGDNLESALHNFMDGVNQAADHASTSIAEVDLNCLKIIVTIGFLANSNDELIEPDVLSKLRQAYSQGTEEKRKGIVAKSRRSGKTGFNVGNDIMFLGERPFQTRKDQESTGRELDYAHIRTGHPHAVRYGAGKKMVKIMWFRPTTVRPDLPFKED
tara:strand:+ start:105 stop:1130 length:1026 start_codon:yes stop_codon:yes gene_type:complete